MKVTWIKNYVFIIIVLTFYSCSNPFDENNVLKYQDELHKIITELEQYDNVTLDRDDIDEFIIDEVRNLSIDFIVKNLNRKNLEYSGFIEENDSLIIFIKKSHNILSVERRIIYDFCKNPRNFGNDSIKGASYRLNQLNDRWYYSEVGFD